jgi:hypothetical protein
MITTKDTITKNEIESVSGVESLSQWKDRYYINITNRHVSKLWLGTDGKIRFEIGKGTNSTEANETIEKILGCNIVDRYRQAAAYIIVK